MKPTTRLIAAVCACLVAAACTPAEGNSVEAGPSVVAGDPDSASAQHAEAGTSSGGPAPDASAPASEASTPLEAGPGPSDAAPPFDGGVADAADDYLGLPAPARGFRLQTRGRTIPPDSDVEYCEVAELPGTAGEEILVGGVEAANARGSHHLIVSAALPGSAADKKLRGLKLGDQVECIGAEIEFGQGFVGFAGSQSERVGANFPKGVAMKLSAGQRVVFDYHYFNFGKEAITAKSAVAVHTLAPADVHTVAFGFAFTNMTIDTPPGTHKTFTAACKFKHDALVMGLNRHTHTRGTDFTVWYEGGAKHGQQIWRSVDWEHDTSFAFDQPALIKAGEGFKFACSFKNDGSKPLRFGIASTDEMCILNSPIWSPTPGIKLADESCVATWIDAQGIGHDAKDNGGPLKPTLDEALACHLNTLGVGFLESCVGCICDSCGSVMVRCNADPDCKALLDCRSSCQAGENCDEKCEAQMFEHSSAVGMIAQVGTCIEAKCGQCQKSAADAGTP